MTELQDIGEDFYEYNLQKQTDKCEKIIMEVKELILEEGLTKDKLELVGAIESEVKDMEESTKELFDNPDRIGDINRQIRRILLKISEDFGYEQKLYNRSNNLQDNISNLFYWFKLVAKSNLDARYHDVEHGYAIHECRIKRNNIEHGGPNQNIRPDLIGIGLLTWYALYEILLNWREAQETLIYGEMSSIQDDEHNEYGFIYKLNDNEGGKSKHTITRYSEGEKGNNIAFETQDVEFFPTEGEVVSFTEEERDGTPIAKNISKL